MAVHFAQYSALWYSCLSWVLSAPPSKLHHSLEGMLPSAHPKYFPPRFNIYPHITPGRFYPHAHNYRWLPDLQPQLEFSLVLETHIFNFILGKITIPPPGLRKLNHSGASINFSPFIPKYQLTLPSLHIFPGVKGKCPLISSRSAHLPVYLAECPFLLISLQTLLQDSF